MGERTTKVIGFSVPPEIYEEVVGYAKKEKMTKSEFFRELVTVYRAKKEEEERNRLIKPEGVQGKSLLSFLGCMDDKSSKEIQEAIEEACEKVDIDEW
ncbi:MAG: hypothetical protein SCK29_11945 [Bacillota bacterium]|nr:hypothetical protein [Bacillota bacterium]MDW7684816.1 hypothetical protein [Bacillota bacterium]